MFLARSEILERLKGDLTISPLLDREQQVENGSVNIRLGTSIVRFDRTQLGEWDTSTATAAMVRKRQKLNRFMLGAQFYLHPGELILASTFEYIALPQGLAGFILSRSRYGRAGLLVATAVYVHPGWKGRLTLELVNVSDMPIKLVCGYCIAQLLLTEVIGAAPMKQHLFPTQAAFTADFAQGEEVVDKIKTMYDLMIRNPEPCRTASAPG